MKKDQVKSYRLKKWYPSLPEDVKEGHIINYDGVSYDSDGSGGYLYLLSYSPKTWISSKELHPDFWEEVKEVEKPLFTTNDNIDIYHGDSYISISVDFLKISMTAYNCDAPYSSDIVRFSNKRNADRYILYNKPVFSLKDIYRYTEGYHPKAIVDIAKDRVGDIGSVDDIII